MKNFTLITALSLCSFSWISVSGSESQTVEAQVGEEVTLLSTNMSKYDSVSFWVKLVNGTKASCITVKITSDNAVVYCDGFSKEKYEMTSNISTVFLKIKHLELSDSGLYFCGFYESGRPNFSVIHLHVKEGSDQPHDDVDSKCENSDGIAHQSVTSVILGSVTGFLVMVITGLIVTVRKLQTAADEEQRPQQCENLDSDDLKDAALSLYLTTIRNRRPESERQVETRVIYAASR
uniref:Immunoglobulin V-set domain-containing protein n=1 Tax=Dicentrarchus labrax TaxID=13489 RepID=A0A8C4I2L0_DICLA